MRTHVLVAILVLAVSSLAVGAEATLKIQASEGIDYISYDTGRIQRNELLRWVQLSPNVDDINYYLVPEWLELCIDKAPEYSPCGSRDLRDPNFFRNAEVNLEKIRNRIRLLEDGAYPPELQPVLGYFVAIQKTFLQAEEHRLTFLKTWDVAVLSGTVGNIDINQSCPAILEQLRQTTDKQTAYKLAQHDLRNCINSTFRKSSAEYPQSTWEQFLNKYSLREKFVPDEVD